MFKSVGIATAGAAIGVPVWSIGLVAIVLVGVGAVAGYTVGSTAGAAGGAAAVAL